MNFDTLREDYLSHLHDGVYNYVLWIVGSDRHTFHRASQAKHYEFGIPVPEILTKALSMELKHGSDQSAVGWLCEHTCSGTFEVRIQDLAMNRQFAARRPARLNGWLIRGLFGSWVWDGPWEQVEWSDWRVIS